LANHIFAVLEAVTVKRFVLLSVQRSVSSFELSICLESFVLLSVQRSVSSFELSICLESFNNTSRELLYYLTTLLCCDKWLYCSVEDHPTILWVCFTNWQGDPGYI